MDETDQTAFAPSSTPTIRTIAMPADTNPAGDIFGGWLLAQMDFAAGAAAVRRARGRCATIAIEAMRFLKPVYVGDEVSLYAKVVHVGRTSMRINVQAWRRSRERGDRASHRRRLHLRCHRCEPEAKGHRLGEVTSQIASEPQRAGRGPRR